MTIETILTEQIDNQDKPLITIVGVSGKQGQSVAQTLLRSRQYRVRGITRRLDSPQSLKLIESGAELVSIPLDLGYKEEYVKAFRGSYGVFMITPGIVPPQTHEAQLGKELADAAVEAGVKHIVFSSLENVSKISGGKKFAPHFTDKATIEEYIRKLPIVSSFIYMAFFYTNFIEFYTPRLDGDTFIFPFYLPKSFSAPFVDPLTATGPAVLELFSRTDKYAGKSLPVIGEIISPEEMVDTFMQVTRKKAVYSPAFTRKDFQRHFPELSSNELLVSEILGMAEYAVEYGYYSKERDLQWSRHINPNSLTWKQFLQTSAWQGEKRSY